MLFRSLFIYRMLTRGKQTQSPLGYAGAGNSSGSGNAPVPREPQLQQPAAFTGNAAPGSLAATIGGAPVAAPAPNFVLLRQRARVDTADHDIGRGSGWEPRFRTSDNKPTLGFSPPSVKPIPGDARGTSRLQASYSPQETDAFWKLVVVATGQAALGRTWAQHLPGRWTPPTRMAGPRSSSRNGEPR